MSELEDARAALAETEAFYLGNPPRELRSLPYRYATRPVTKEMVDTVYLLHFDEPYPGGKRPQHYIGHATTGRFALRISEHRRGSSKARLTQVFAELGIGFVIARTWAGDYDLEKALKRRHRPASLCPICKEERNA